MLPDYNVNNGVKVPRTIRMHPCRFRAMRAIITYRTSGDIQWFQKERMTDDMRYATTTSRYNKVTRLKGGINDRELDDLTNITCHVD